MKATYCHLTGVMLALASILCAAVPHEVVAREAGPSPPNGHCFSPVPAFVKPLNEPHWNGWGVDPMQHRFQSAAMAQLAAGDVPRLKLKWAFGFPGVHRAFAQPTVMGSRIFVGSQGGEVYALDARRGCIYWERDAEAPVRSAITIGRTSAGWAAYFGDLHANVHAVDALTGKPVWTIRVDDHPSAVITGSPTLVGTTLFVPVSSHEEGAAANLYYACCGFRGSIVALNAQTGKLLWKSYTIAQEPKPGTTNAAGVRLMGSSGAAVWSSPTFDAAKSMIYATTSDTKIRIASPDTPGAQPSLFNPEVAWLLDGRTGGGLHALRLDTGKEVWWRPHPGCHGVPGCGPAQSAAVTAIPGIVFSGGLDGHLRAYSADDGRIVWDMDTKGAYRTVNGVAAHGGSIDGPGAVVVGGMLYVTSGSGAWGGIPGNVLLAYSVDGH